MRKLKTVDEAVGGLSDTSKMPGRSWSVSAFHCGVGSKLRKIPGSICSKCYALKGHYVAGSTCQDALERRRSKLRSIRVWTEDMVELLQRGRWNNWEFFRWFDSGDLQSARHLKALVEIAERVPDVSFWLPTKEYSLVRLVPTDRTPKNLVIRVSAAMVAQPPMQLASPLRTSTVGANVGRSCPAYSQGGECGSCRSCWDPTVANVDYPLH